MYWDTMWFARYPGANDSDTQHETLISGPNTYSKPDGFYSALLTLRRTWDHDLAQEGACVRLCLRACVRA